MRLNTTMRAFTLVWMQNLLLMTNTWPAAAAFQQQHQQQASSFSRSLNRLLFAKKSFNPDTSTFSEEDFDSGNNFVGEYAHILDDGKGHIRSDLATSIWNWDHDHAPNHRKFQYSTRQGLRMVDNIAKELLEEVNLSTSTSSSSKEEDSATSSTTGTDSSATMSYADLVQEGVVALMQCMASFETDNDTDKKHGSSFEAYAKKQIYTSMSRAMADDSRALKLPAHVHAVLNKLASIQPELHQELGREPTSIELAEAVGIPLQTLEFYQVLARKTVSVESTIEVYDPLLEATPVYKDESEDWDYARGDLEDELYGQEELYEQEGEDEMWVQQQQIAGPLSEFIPDAGPTPDDLVLEQMMTMDVDNFLLKTLDDRELTIIEMRYGIHQTGNNKEKTLQEIASILKISKQRVAQIEERAMDKLRTSYTNRYVETYLDDEEHEDIVDSV